MYWLILLLLFLPLNLNAAFSVSGVDNPASVSGVEEPASVAGVESDYGEESTLKDSSSASANASRYFGYNSVVGAGSHFTAGSSYTLTSFKLYTSKSGTGGSCTVTGYIYSNSSGSPNAVLGTSTNTHTGAEFGSQLEWTFEGVSISNATAYWIVLLANSSSCGSTGNYPNFIYNNEGSLTVKYWDGSTWTNTDTSADFNFETYGY